MPKPMNVGVISKPVGSYPAGKTSSVSSYVCVTYRTTDTDLAAESSPVVTEFSVPGYIQLLQQSPRYGLFGSLEN